MVLFVIVAFGVYVTTALVVGWFIKKAPVVEDFDSGLDHIGGRALGASVDPQAWKR